MPEVYMYTSGLPFGISKLYQMSTTEKYDSKMLGQSKQTKKLFSSGIL